MSNPTAAMLAIGDEILSGRTQDTNTHHLAGKLTEIGVDLCEVRVVGDGQSDIVAALNALRARYDYVFTSGGIGPTHDDITADSIAAAFGVGIDIRADARAVLATNYKNPEKELNAARLRMARIPDGAVLIDNPVSKAPGFRLENVHVMAGVPSVFHAMLENILPTLQGGNPLLSVTVPFSVPEGKFAEKLAGIAGRNPDLSYGSYPFLKDGVFGSNIVVRGTDATRLSEAEHELKLLATAFTA